MKDLIFNIMLFGDISNSENDTVITGTADADSINNDGSNVTIQALDGNDTVTNNGIQCYHRRGRGQ